MVQHMKMINLRTPFVLIELLVLSASHTRADVTSTFDFDSDGWIKNPNGDAATTVSWVGIGGNPGGHLRLVDGAQGRADHIDNESNLIDNVALIAPELDPTMLAACGIAAIAFTHRRRSALNVLGPA